MTAMAMQYAQTAIPDGAVPRAGSPGLQHVLDTYASETNKVVSVWRGFGDDDWTYRPHERSSTVGEILKHQLLSERRFFGEFLGTAEPAPADVLPPAATVSGYATRLVELAVPRLGFGRTATHCSRARNATFI
jgi:hypothetical protein